MAKKVIYSTGQEAIYLQYFHQNILAISIKRLKSHIYFIYQWEWSSFSSTSEMIYGVMIYSSDNCASYNDL